MPFKQPGLLAPQQSPEPTARQLYGLLAQYGDDPAAAATGYMNTRLDQQGLDLQQQRLDQFNDPMERYLRLYGNINPHDFTGESIKAFHENYVGTGQMDHSLLKRYDPLSSKEQGFLNQAINDAMKAESDIGRMTDLSNRFDEFARQGIPQGRLAGGISEWMKGVLGSEDAVSQLRTEYEQLKISNVVQNLPPGVASDKDVELVLRGWPSGVSDPAYIASFLRGMRKLRAVDGARAAHRAGYLNRNAGESGLLEDWQRNRDWMIRDAIQEVGGVWNPGDDVSAEEAARMRYQRDYGAAPPPSPTAPRRRSREELLNDPEYFPR
jgi:hypothetical protein